MEKKHEKNRYCSPKLKHTVRTALSVLRCLIYESVDNGVEGTYTDTGNKNARQERIIVVHQCGTKEEY